MTVGGRQTLFISCVTLVFGATAPISMTDALRADDQAALEHFEKKIRPVLVEHCYDCHSAAAKEVKGSFVVDHREGMRLGGDSGPAIIPGKPEESLLISALRHDGLEMPPKKKLPQAVIDDFVHWIEEGAVDPREAPADPQAAGESARTAQYDQRRHWWSLEPITKPQLPTVNDEKWSAGVLDQFLLAKLEAASLMPTTPADRTTLIRRLSFGLTGLPPSPDAVDDFLSDKAPDAWERQIDRGLASPHFGERWARHWMDVVRYTDTYGYEWDIPAKGAWRYRDYLIRAFNADVPFNQLIREQLAGDLLFSPRLNFDEHINESLIGPMFYQMGEKRHGDSSEFDGIHQEMLDNKIDAFSKAFLATTVSCARCHDHKLDAVHQAEYYALGGAFMSSRWVTNTVDLPDRQASFRHTLREIRTQMRPALASLWQRDATAISVERWRELRQAFGEKEPPLEDPLAIWSTVLAAQEKETPLAETWMQLREKYQAEHAERTKKNADNFTLVADFREGIPVGWSVDGVGLQDITPRGDFTVALTGDAAIGQILPGGLMTFADSPRLNGALRTPILNTLEPGHLSFEVCGGDFAARRAVIDNAFLTEKQVYLKQNHVEWQRADTYGSMPQRHIYLEFATKTSNPNFPPRVGLGGACSEEQIAEPQSWFGITKVVRHQAPFTPVDELTLLQRYFDGDAPQSLEDVARKFATVCELAIAHWNNGKSDDDEVRLLNWYLDHQLLSNRRDLPEITAMVDHYRQVENEMPLPWTVNGMSDLDPGYNLNLLNRGEYDQPRDSVPRGSVSAIQPLTTTFHDTHSGRLELAEQIASPTNPLTSRVFVNRVWHWLFGTGIVASTSDFGHAGDHPSHSELLDDLANDFTERDWSLKRVVRRIVTSAAWRQSSHTTDEALNRDPANRLLHYYPLRRLEAEAIRDAVFLSSGRLDESLYGAPINPPRQNEDSQKRLFSGPLDGQGRRSIYTKVTIMEPPKFLAVFNQPAPKIPTGLRDITNTPAQALALMNDPLIKQQAEYWASRLVTEADSQPEVRIQRMFLIAFSRPPTSDEVIRWVAGTNDLAELHGVSPENVMASLPVWTDLAHALFNTKEFLYGL